MFKRLVVAACLLGAVLVAFGSGHRAAPALAATCADFANQAAAQAAANTWDADGDGIYCESLPCPCSTASPAPPSPPAPSVPPETTTTAPPPPPPTTTTEPPPATAVDPADSATCTRPSKVQNITFSKTKYPNIRKHFLKALRKGWPRTLVVNRSGSSARRDRLLAAFPTRADYDRDEYPPAVGRGRGAGLMRGLDPIGWNASVAYVRSSENRSHGSTMGLKLRRFCSGTKFRYVFY